MEPELQLHPVTAEFRKPEYTKMAKLLNWTTVLLVLALIVAIARVSFLGLSTQLLVIILIVLALISIIIMGDIDAGLLDYRLDQRSPGFLGPSDS
jgi:uncharacterized membrane protein (UPF0182 family)